MASHSDENAPIIPSNLQHRRKPQPLSRADSSDLSRWYAEVDRGLLLMIVGLMAIGLLAVAVAAIVWRTRIRLIWLVAAGAVLGGFGWV